MNHFDTEILEQIDVGLLKSELLIPVKVSIAPEEANSESRGTVEEDKHEAVTITGTAEADAIDLAGILQLED